MAQISHEYDGLLTNYSGTLNAGNALGLALAEDITVTVKSTIDGDNLIIYQLDKSVKDILNEIDGSLTQLDTKTTQLENQVNNINIPATSVAYDENHSVKDMLDGISNVGTEGKSATYYETAEEYNAAKGTSITELEFEELSSEAKIKTEAVDATGIYAKIENIDSNVVKATNAASAATAASVVSQSAFTQSQQYLTRLNSTLNSSIQTLSSKELAISDSLEGKMGHIIALEETALDLKTAFENSNEMDFAIIPELGYLNLIENGGTNSNTIYFCYDPSAADLDNEDHDIYCTVNAGVYQNNNLYGAVGGSGHYTPNTTVKLYAVANSGYLFTSWVDSNDTIVSYSNPYSFLTLSNTLVYNYYAKFERIQSQNTINVISSNFNIADIYMKVDEQHVYTLSVQNGASVNIYIDIYEPDEYELVSLKNNVNDISYSNPITELIIDGVKRLLFTVPVSEDITYTAEIKEIGEAILTLSVNPSYAGTIIGGTKYKKGNTVLLQAVPDSSGWFDFVNWSNNSTENPLIIANITLDRTISAIFELSVQLALSETYTELAPVNENNTLALTTTTDYMAKTLSLPYYIVAFKDTELVSCVLYTLDVDVTENISDAQREISNSVEITKKGYTYTISYTITQDAPSQENNNENG